MSIRIERVTPVARDTRAEEVMVRARDGVRLATNIYLGDRGAPRATVLVRLPYDKDAPYCFMPELAPIITARGYNFVVQDVRGKFRSEGETLPCAHELEDGYDTLEWIEKQSWSNGVVGMFGDSYFGYTQWAAVASQHRALRAIAPRVNTADLGMTLTGRRRTDTVFWLNLADYVVKSWTDQSLYDFAVDWSARPLRDIYEDAFASIGARSAAFDGLVGTWEDPRLGRGPEWKTHPRDVCAIPVLHQVGWFDNMMRDYVSLSGRPEVARNQFLLADASDHENYRLADVPITAANDHEVDATARERLLTSYIQPTLEFFDWALRADSPSPRFSPVRYYVGHDQWYDDAMWPPTRSRELSLFLGGDRAGADAQGGHLAEHADASRIEARWTHDPENLVPSTAEQSFSFLKEYPEESRVQGRDDVLTYTGPAYERPLDLAGPVSARLYLGSSGPSMNVHVKLTDVAPDGRSHLIVRGDAVVSKPDPDTAVDIPLGHTGYRLMPGHRLRLHIASSDWPLFIWHPGTDENPWTARSGARNGQVLTTGGSTPSRITVTIKEGRE